MKQLTKAGKASYIVRRFTLCLVQHLPSKAFLGEIKTIHKFVRDKIRYVKDINGIETLHTPEKTLQIGQGDCDDQSILIASMLESIGHPTRFRAVGFFPGHFSHVFTETKYGRKWIALETTEKWPIGRTPKNIASTMVVRNA